MFTSRLNQPLDSIALTALEGVLLFGAIYMAHSSVETIFLRSELAQCALGDGWGKARGAAFDSLVDYRFLISAGWFGRQCFYRLTPRGREMPISSLPGVVNFDS